MAEFLEVPISSVQRAFTLSLKAKPKKKSNATAPMDGGTTSAWSDEVQSPLIATAWSDEVHLDCLRLVGRGAISLDCHSLVGRGAISFDCR